MSLSTTDPIEAGNALKRLVTDAQNSIEELTFLKRILKQAILTHGGKLPIDPQFSEQAKNDKRELCIGNGGVEFV